ncbi:PREDICTED: protein GREB1 [Myotis davidii]|uniref:protein GREB1 n=1 Tax=Myotis davidii TaxID=225400 RepID=UPI000766F21F|nr:PREDICTED: protein GREB1 [Myotis davidii]
MGNSYAGQLKSTRFEEVLHNSIEASLRSSSLVPRPVFSQLYLEAEQQLSALEGGSRVDNEEEEEEGDGGLEPSCPPTAYQMHPPPEGCCTTDGFCQAGKDLRLVSICSEPIDVPAGFLLVGAKAPSLPGHLLVSFLMVGTSACGTITPPGCVPGFSGNCVGCGKKGFCYFTEFSNHINLKLTTQPKKQKHLKCYLVRNAQGVLAPGPLICWKGSELRGRQAPTGPGSSSLFPPPPDSSGPPAACSSEPSPGTNPSAPVGAQPAGPGSDPPSLPAAAGPAVFNGKDSPQQQLAKGKLPAGPRPSALGIFSNSGPPKKRHKGWSPESPSAADGGYPKGAGSRAKYESAGVACVPPVGLVGPASVTFPVVASGEPVSVPDNLLKICKAKPVIFKGHGNFPYLCGNLNDVVVSPLLYTCYQNSQSVSRAYEQYGAPALQPISEEMQLLLTVYYLVQLGKYQARVLSESLLTPAEYQEEVSYELVTGKVASLGAFFSTLCPEGDIDILLDKFHQENQGHVSSSPTAASVTKPMSLEVGGAPACTSSGLEPQRIRPFQLAVAQKLLSHLCSIADSSTQNLDLGSFEKVDFLICIPPSEVTYQQTLFHVWHSGVLLELGLDKEHVTRQRVEQYVLKLDAEAQARFQVFLQNSFQNPHTLFVLVHDHAHWDLVSSAVHNLYSPSDPSVGLVDRLLNCREVKEAPNIVTLHVTSFPYALQTQHTLISPYNEIHWPASYSTGADLYPEDRKYFGLSEFIESTLSGHSLPLLRYDSSFEAMVTALGKRFPRLHSAVIRTFVLVQHYAAAMMAVRGLSQMKNYTSVETLEITQNLINAPQQCPCGHGLMVLLRVPCSPLAAVAYERLAHVRARLALEQRFEIILGSPSSGLTVGKHFVKQLKMWQNIEDAEWRPQTYLELEGLPCILIFSGMDPHGESLPRSLRYCDLRLINSSCLVRTALEQELGLAAYFVSSEGPLERGPRSEGLESDAEKPSSTDNEDEELVTEGSTSEKKSPVKRERSGSRDSASSGRSSKASGSALGGETSAPPGGPPQGEQTRSPQPCDVVFLPKLVYDMVTSTDSSGLPKAASLLPSPSVVWASSFRPLLSKTMTSTEQSLYYRQWTVPRPSHMDYGNRAEGCVDGFHPRRLLLSGPPQIGKTGAYLQFLSILSRMLIRLTEVDVYDEEEINVDLREESEWRYLQLSDPWPDLELFRKLPFDYTVHDPKYEDASLICSHHQGAKSEDRGPPRKPEDLFVRRQTARMRLSKYAAHNTYHHCEQCHQYMGFHPRYQWLPTPRSRRSPGYTGSSRRPVVGKPRLFGPFLIKELSYHNLELERNRQEELGIKPQDIWPFIVISDDSCVMWNVVDVDGGGERSREFSWSERNVSLKHIMQHIEAAPNITHYALIGMRKWSSKAGGRAVREPFSRCHVHDFIVLNVDLTQNVQYNQSRFLCDDVDFNLRVHSAGLLLCRFNRFSVMKKQIAGGGHRSFHITAKVSDNPVAVVPAQYICAPDSKHPSLAAPAQLLLERFLQHHSHRFFPLSLRNHGHPVLLVDCYLNLGSQISVCYVSSRPHSLNVSCSDSTFSGLLLYLCDSFVGASFLKKFHFLKGATLCVICQDRNSLRQTVVRLELEDEWQFRLRDEFQTANAKEDRPLFFLTGRHI